MLKTFVTFYNFEGDREKGALNVPLLKIYESIGNDRTYMGAELSIPLSEIFAMGDETPCNGFDCSRSFSTTLGELKKKLMSSHLLAMPPDYCYPVRV
jgi:hypothetical protein